MGRIATLLCLHGKRYRPHRVAHPNASGNGDIAVDAEGQRLDDAFPAVVGKELERVEIGDPGVGITGRHDATTYVAENKLVTPADQNAYAYVQKALQKDPQNEQAQALLGSIGEGLKSQAETGLKEGRLDQAYDAASQGLLVRPDDGALKDLKARIEQV